MLYFCKFVNAYHNFNYSTSSDNTLQTQISGLAGTRCRGNIAAVEVATKGLVTLIGKDWMLTLFRIKPSSLGYLLE